MKSLYNYVLKNGIVVDGTRKKPYHGSVCIDDGRIVAITNNTNAKGEIVVDVGGKIISPGFIDIHTHSDAFPLNTTPAESMLYQGVTTEIAGNCGITLFPSKKSLQKEIREYFARTIEINLEDQTIQVDSMSDYVELSKVNKLPINIGTLIGHGTLRACIMGFEDKDPTDEELQQMKELLERELKDGAFGMSLGLIYPPSSYGKINEFIELAKVIKENNGILTVHMRNESDLIFDAVDEMIEVAKKSGVHLQISHLKLIGKKQWHKSQLLLEKIETARSKGCNITCDQYPYQATSTSLSALVPNWAQDGGNQKMIERLKTMDSKLLKDITEEMEKRGGPTCVGVSSTHGHFPALDGKNIEEISQIYLMSSEKTVAQLLIDCAGEVSAIYYSLNLDDVLNIMKDMNIAIGSDGYNFTYNLNYNPHPRSFGTFPRFLQMVRENNLMPIEDAIYKITGLPANILGLSDRGVLEVGNIADITVFDKDLIEDKSTFINPAVKPVGVEHVFVAGIPALLNGEQTEHRTGKVIFK